MEGTYVYLTQGIWMGKFLVTQAEWQNVMSNNPSYFSGNPNRPVEQVSWFDAVQYCQTLTASAQAAGQIATNWAYRLPTEAEWEYACRAGTTNTYYFGEDPYGTRLPFYSWYSVNSGGQTHDVGTRAPNPWGLYDMSGNVWEWCQDWYGSLPGGNVTDPQGPQGPSSGWARIIRGGSLGDGAGTCASAYRNWTNPSNRGNNVGFRVVLAPVQ
jgi:formylglycine-generating enzyme required for sulfatase activity